MNVSFLSSILSCLATLKDSARKQILSYDTLMDPLRMHTILTQLLSSLIIAIDTEFTKEYFHKQKCKMSSQLKYDVLNVHDTMALRTLCCEYFNINIFVLDVATATIEGFGPIDTVVNLFRPSIILCRTQQCYHEPIMLPNQGCFHYNDPIMGKLAHMAKSIVFPMLSHDVEVLHPQSLGLYYLKRYIAPDVNDAVDKTSIDEDDYVSPSREEALDDFVHDDEVQHEEDDAASIISDISM